MSKLLDKFNTLRLYFDALPTPVSVLDEQGTYLYCNIAFYEDFLKKTYDPFTLLGKKNTDLVDESAARILDSNHYLTLKLGFSQFFEEHIKHNDEYVYWLSLKKPLLDSNGKPKLLINVFIDITERKLNEKKLGLNIFDDNKQPFLNYIYGNQSVSYLDQGAKLISKKLSKRFDENSILSSLQSFDVDNEDSLSVIVELIEITLLNFPGNIYVKDKDLRIKFINLNLAKDLGVSHYIDLLEKKETEFLPKELVEKQLQHDEQVLSSNKVFIREEPIHLNGKNRCYLSFKRSVINPLNNQKLLIGISIDYTIQKQLDTNIRDAINSQSINQKSKETFITSISHDIRTPITGMLGLISLIKSDLNSHPEIYNKVTALENLTNEFLSFFNGILQTLDNDSANLNLAQKKPIELKELVNKCVALFKPALMYQDVYLTTFFGNHLPSHINCNERMIKQIIINLVGNAVKFSEKGEVKIIITSDKKNMLNIVVSDQGIGINESEFEKIFERFTRLDMSPNSKYAGSGLGLYVVKKYVALLSGCIKVKSKLGQGSSFSITMPVEPIDYKLIKNKKDVVIKEQEKNFSQSDHKTILIVEDNKLAALALSHSINSLGYKIQIASTGKEALACIRKNKYKCVFLDLGLPDQSGLDVLMMMREDSFNMPIHMLSGHVSEDMADSCRQAGASGIYTKPMLLNQIKEALSNCK